MFLTSNSATGFQKFPFQLIYLSFWKKIVLLHDNANGGYGEAGVEPLETLKIQLNYHKTLYWAEHDMRLPLTIADCPAIPYILVC